MQLWKQQRRAKLDNKQPEKKKKEGNREKGKGKKGKKEKNGGGAAGVSWPLRSAAAEYVRGACVVRE